MLGFTPLASAPLGEDGGVEVETVRAGYDSIPTGSLPDWLTNGLATVALSVASITIHTSDGNAASPNEGRVISSTVIATTPAVGFAPVTVAKNSPIGYPDLAILDRKSNTIIPKLDASGNVLYYEALNSPFTDFNDYLILGWTPKTSDYGGTERPIWDESHYSEALSFKALSYATKIRSAVADTPLVYQDATAFLVNGEYTLPTTSTPTGSAVAKEITLYQHSEVPVDNGDGTQTITITSLSDPLALALTTDIDDQTIYPNSGTDRFASVFVGALQTLNTYDPTNTTGSPTVTTYLDPTIPVSVATFYGEADATGISTNGDHFHYQATTNPQDERMGGPEKFRNLFKDLPSKGFDIHNPLNPSINGLRAQRIKAWPPSNPGPNTYYGLAWVKYGIQLQPAITAVNFPDGTPVPQTHTLLTNLGLGQIQVNIIEPLFDQAAGHTETVTHLPTIDFQLADLPSRGKASPEIGSVFVTGDVITEGFDLGTASLPDPQWFLNPARPQLVAEAKRPADDHVYPYAGRDLVVNDAPAVSFDQVFELGILAGPKAVRKNLNEFPGYDASTTYELVTSLGPLVTSTVNILELPETVEATQSLGTIQANIAFPVPDFPIALGHPATDNLTILAESGALSPSYLMTGTAAADSEIRGAANIVAPAAPDLTLSENLNWDYKHTALTNPVPIADKLNLGVGVAGVQQKLDLSRTGVPDTSELSLNPELLTKITMFFPSFVIYENHNFSIEQLAIHFDFEAIKHLYSRKRGVSAGIPQSRIVNPTFATPRHLKLALPKQHLDA